MHWHAERKNLAWIVAGFLACFYLPVGVARFDHVLLEMAQLVKW